VTMVGCSWSRRCSSSRRCFRRRTGRDRLRPDCGVQRGGDDCRRRGRRAPPRSGRVVIDDGSADRTAERAAAPEPWSSATRRTEARFRRSHGARAVFRAWTHVLLLDGDLQPTRRHPEAAGRRRAERLRPGDRVKRPSPKGEMPTARFYSNAIRSWILSRFVGTEDEGFAVRFRLVRTSCLRPLDAHRDDSTRSRPRC